MVIAGIGDDIGFLKSSKCEYPAWNLFETASEIDELSST